jgi:hypothetical protein
VNPVSALEYRLAVAVAVCVSLALAALLIAVTPGHFTGIVQVYIGQLPNPTQPGLLP